MNNVNNFLRLVTCLVIGYLLGSIVTCVRMNKKSPVIEVKVDTIQTYTHSVEYIHDTFTKEVLKPVVKIKYEDLIKYRDTGSVQIRYQDTGSIQKEYIEVIKKDSIPIDSYQIDTSLNINGTEVNMKSSVVLLGTMIDFNMSTKYEEKELKTVNKEISLVPKLGINQKPASFTPILGLQLIVNKLSLEGLYDMNTKKFGGLIGYKIKLR